MQKNKAQAIERYQMLGIVLIPGVMTYVITSVKFKKKKNVKKETV